MKINQVEQLAGITKGNIRFYEKEGLLTPGRNSENGYREYDEADVIWLKKIRLLRMLDVPIEEILKLKAGEITLRQAMDTHETGLEQRRTDLSAMQEICARIRDSHCDLDTLDADAVLAHMEHKEQEGTRFMNVRGKDDLKRYVPPVTAAVVVLILFGALAAGFIWACTRENPPIGLVIGFVIVMVAVIAGVLIALFQRVKQIKGGEEDAASEY